MAICFKLCSNKYVYALITSRALSHYHLQDADKPTDPLDNFTTRLIQTKCSKWKAILDNARSSSKVKPTLFNNRNGIQIDTMDCETLDAVTRSAIEDDDMQILEDLVTQFIRIQKLPSNWILLRILWLHFQAGKLKEITLLSHVCSTTNAEFAKQNANFEDLSAGAIWVMGDTHKALSIYERVYRNHNVLRNRIRKALKFLIADSIDRRSEAALITLLDFVKRLSVEFDDYLPMSYLWQACFLSEWYSDQTLALQLLEDRPNLLESVSCRIPTIVALALATHKKEVVHRLLELFLVYKMVDHYGGLVIALFDYEGECI